MSEPSERSGFLSAVGALNLRDIVWPEGAIALLLGTGGGIALLHSATVAERISLVGDGINTLGMLLGVVFAAFALLIALFSSEYVQLLNQASDGVAAFMRPFIVALGCEITAIFLSMGYRVSANDLNSKVEVGAFLAWSTLFTFTLVDVLGLARSIFTHGIHRATQIEINAEAGQESAVTPITKRTGESR